MQSIAGHFQALGFEIMAAPELSALLRDVRGKFESRMLNRFSDDALRNRNLIKLVAEDLDVKRFFCAPELVTALRERIGIAEPVQTGPIVTHYTANNTTGNNYGLPYHQDWPSMGTSSNGVITWTSITDIGKDGPGLRVIPGSHLNGLWPGEQTQSGYVLEQQEIDGFLDVEVEAGQILFMSPYLVHKTRTASIGNWKLSLSCRFDDLECRDWDRRDFVSAYRTAVDRQVYLSGFD
ncbi:phytanoyl-CoA dioxygenase family protein [Burkholderia gladioli]|uniref:phytanoyl-CoA dioxygenase family protein n=1 Tax=Burkholderia gladioli TaxID=28095 RepID=UPI00069DC114|nr:phytanoyl-CoA dioxygenase family protein [Burkholderia gladioli]